MAHVYLVCFRLGEFFLCDVKVNDTAHSMHGDKCIGYYCQVKWLVCETKEKILCEQWQEKAGISFSGRACMGGSYVYML